MRGQIQQLFLFLMAAMVIVATIFLGVKLIGNLTSTSCKANDVGFQRELTALLDENAVFGSRNTVQLGTPCEALDLCFVDAQAIGNAAFTSTNPTITAVVRSGSKTNVFLHSDDGTVSAGYDERIILRDTGSAANLNALCIKAVGGVFSFKIDGYGRNIKVSS